MSIVDLGDMKEEFQVPTVCLTAVKRLGNVPVCEHIDNVLIIARHNIRLLRLIIKSVIIFPPAG